MNKVTLTLQVTYQEAIQIMQLLNTSPEAHTKPLRPLNNLEDKVPAVPTKTPSAASKSPGKVVAPTAGKTVKMPGFMRTQEQIDTYAASEDLRMEAKDEEAELKLQRAADRAVRKTEKDAVENEKKAEAQLKQDEVASIKEAVVDTTPPPLPKKPWHL